MATACEIGMLLSEEDHDLQNANVQRAGGYAKCWVRWDGRRGRYVMVHRIVLERMIGRRLMVGEQCDHINRNKLDNRRSNLRLSDASRNTHNKPPASNTGVRGVYWDKKQGRFVWSVSRRGVRVRGYAASVEDAQKKLEEAIQHIGYELSSLS